jgi:serine/threonine protein kinase
LKPANILVNSKGSIKIADFGMSGHKVFQKEKNMEQFTTFQGTFTYMVSFNLNQSPERLEGKEHSYDSDIWSLGLTIAQCALGKFPYELQEFTIFEMMSKVEKNNDITKILPETFSKEIKEFISACMKMKPNERSTPEELLEFDFITKNQKSKPSIGILFIFKIIRTMD